MKVKTLHEIHDEGMNAREKTLGPVDMVRFIQMFGHGTGDYTKERKQWLPTDLKRDISRDSGNAETGRNEFLRRITFFSFLRINNLKGSVEILTRFVTPAQITTGAHSPGCKRRSDAGAQAPGKYHQPPVEESVRNILCNARDDRV